MKKSAHALTVVVVVVAEASWDDLASPVALGALLESSSVLQHKEMTPLLYIPV